MAKSDFKKELFVMIDRDTDGEKFNIAWDKFEDCAVAGKAIEVGIYRLERVSKVEAKPELK